MSDWQERITHETAPAIRAEHDLRYLLAAPLVLAGGAWADLGCGNGVAAARALGNARAPHTVLVDIEEQAVAEAARELDLPDATILAGDLTDPEDLRRIGEALLSVEGAPLVTCFEVIEHLSSFVALLEWATGLAVDHQTTFLLSVPNDAFWSIQNPHHHTSWSEGAFRELQQLLPAEHTLLRQVSLSGSAATRWDAAPESYELAVQAGGEGAVATHFLAAFGPRHRDVQTGALAIQTDMREQRRWERQRESNLAVAEATLAEQRAALDVQEERISKQRQELHEQEATINRQREELRSQTAQFDEWRSYIHELERELGRPLSGSEPDPAGSPEPQA